MIVSLLGTLLETLVLGFIVAPTIEEPTSALPPAEVGRGERIDFVPDSATATRNGDRYFYATLFERKNASFVKPHFVDLHLAPGDILTVRSRSGAIVETLSGRGPGDRGTFWGLSAFGPELFLELDSAAPYTTPPFRLDRLIVGNANLASAMQPKSLCGTEDYDDAICFQSDAAKWKNVQASVGIMTIGGDPLVALWCSGSNVSPLGYVLTNFHCVDSTLGCLNTEFVFRYWRTQCNVNAPPTMDWVGFHCAEFVKGSPLVDCEVTPSTLDFALLRTAGDPTAEFGFVQPDPTPLSDGEAIYIVQHADGRPHEITHGGGADVDVDGQTLRYYGTLDTDDGSSGSPIFRDADDTMVALHHCGGCATPGEGNRGMLMSDLHPHLVDYVCNPPLSLVVNGSTPLVEIFGNGDPFLDPGETHEFRLKLTNMSCLVDAQDVTALLLPNPASAPIVLWHDVATFGTIAHGVTATQSNTIRFTLSPSAPCSGTVELDLTAIQTSNGGPFSGKPNVFSMKVGSGGSATLYSTDFDEAIPSWALIDRGDALGFDDTWQLSWDPSIPLLPPYAIASASVAGPELMDEQLITPPIDCRGWGAVTLQFRFEFDEFPGGVVEHADVDVRSRATNGQWVNVAKYEGGDTNGLALINLTPFAADESGVEVRFHYWNAIREGRWAIDDLFVIGFASPCDAQSFAKYGASCAGISGKKPALVGSGSATPGGAISLSVSGGAPATDGALFVAAQPLSFGCLLVAAPQLGPFLLPLDGAGHAIFVSTLPPALTPGFHTYLQWFGSDGSASNGIDVFIH